MGEYRVYDVKEMKHFDEEKDTETDEPATLEEKFEYLLDILNEKQEEIDNLIADFCKFDETWQNHRHSIGDGVYSGKAER